MGLFESMGPPVPVTVIGGFLGAGKTTLLNRLLHDAGGRRIAVLVNDFGEVNIDAELIVGVEGDVIKMSNGCICCTIKSDVTGALIRLIEREDRPEHVAIETSGISNPGAVVEMLIELQRMGAIRLDGVVSLVDAEHFLDLEGESAQLARLQARAADVAVISKCDLVDRARVDAVRAKLGEHAPHLRIIEAIDGDVPIDLLMAGDEGEVRAPDHRDHDGCEEHDHSDDLDAHGFRSWCFTTTAPVRFSALKDVLKALPREIHRAKGFLNLVERPGDRLVLHVVGRRIFVRTIGSWAEERPATKLVLIGRAGEGVDWPKIQADLEGCACGHAAEREPRR
jgi:G3E family GTPase